MNVTFKDVGQGDSILIEFEKDSKLKIGIIDCNVKGRHNPIVDYLRSLKDFSIEFIILSHPHTDHFSGFLDLLELVRERKIDVKYFLHTCISRREYLRQSLNSIGDKKKLERIFNLAHQLNISGIIENYGFVNDLTSEIELVSGIKMKILAPNDGEYTKYNSRAFKNDFTGINNPDANLLSTVVKLFSGSEYAIFTSDATREVFWRLNRKMINELSKKKLLFGQIPHHGSVGSFYDTFWRLINERKPSTAVISVGENSYDHPSEKVVSDLKMFGYEIRSTKSDYDSSIEFAQEISSTLDLFSEKIVRQNTNSYDCDVSINVF